MTDEQQDDHEPGGPVVAIDGPAGSGKSTVARLVAERLGVPHVDTGALYRAVTLAVLRDGADPDDAEAGARLVDAADVGQRPGGTTTLDGEDVSSQIRGPEVTGAVSSVSAQPAVRDAMTPLQRRAARDGGVLEGRDIGTVVFPDADVKVFLTASVGERARRRAAETGDDVEEVLADLGRRDALDSERDVAPLRAAEDAWHLDTTGLAVDEVVDAVVAHVEHHLDVVAAVTSEHDDESSAPSAMAGDVVTVTEEVRTRDDLPRLAVVGRPNVGKSTLVNRILGERVTIVEEKSGVTRDRTEHVAVHEDRAFLLVDTGGWEHGADGMNARIVEQAEAAIESADGVLFITDVTVGALEDDVRYAKLLRRAGVPVTLLANKADGDKQALGAAELYALGLGEPLPVSALHGDGVRHALDLALDALPAADGRDVDLDETTIPHVALVGRPNVGKSSLFNRLVGQERSIVSPVAHTTRDSIDTHVTVDGEPWVFVDTAGMRRRYRTGERTEMYAVDRTRRAIELADVVLFLVDASEPLGEQDQKLAALVRDAGRGVVLVLNKWDEVDDVRRGDLERELSRLLFFAAWAPRVNVSALTGRGVRRLVPQLRVVWDAYNRRIPTGELNRFVRDEVARTPPPPGKGGRTFRLRYLAQVATRPPRFKASTNGPMPAAYLRFFQRRLRETYGFPGVPLVIDDGRDGDGRRRRDRGA